MRGITCLYFVVLSYRHVRFMWWMFLTFTTIFRTPLNHGRPQSFFQGGQHRNFAYTFQVADGAMEMDVHKTLHRFHPICLYWLILNSQSLV